MDKLDKRMDKFDKRMGGFDKRMDGFDKRMDGFDKRMDTFATKTDLSDAMMGMKRYVDQRFDEFEERIEEKMYTKADHSKFMVWMDEAMKELRDTRQERILSDYNLATLDDTVDNHEKRICALESK
jgi:hypothetical protein